MDKRMILLVVANGIFVALIIGLDFMYLRDVPNLFSSVIVFAIIIFIVPIALLRYFELSKIRELEDSFPQFMRDIVESVRSGMTLPLAIEAVAENDYGRLSGFVRRLNAQLSWGIPFSKALLQFSRRSKSRLIGRIASTIIESHRYGGNLTEIFEAISETTVEVERLREERKLYLNSQLMSGYIIFFVFIAVIIGLQKFLVPTLSQISVQKLGMAVGAADIEQQYEAIFRNLIIIQAIFAGLVIGKMAEGAVAGGIKHSMFMLIAGMVIYTAATAF